MKNEIVDFLDFLKDNRRSGSTTILLEAFRQAPKFCLVVANEKQGIEMMRKHLRVPMQQRWPDNVDLYSVSGRLRRRYDTENLPIAIDASAMRHILTDVLTEYGKYEVKIQEMTELVDRVDHNASRLKSALMDTFFDNKKYADNSYSGGRYWYTNIHDIYAVAEQIIRLKSWHFTRKTEAASTVKKRALKYKRIQKIPYGNIIN